MKLDKIRFARLIAHLTSIISNRTKLSVYDIEDIDNLIDFDAHTKQTFNCEDLLYKLLLEGKADADAQLDAAKWIKTLHS